MTSSGESPRFVHRFKSVLEKVNWTTLLAGVTIGMVGLQMLTGGPLNERLNSVESELYSVRLSLDEVAGSRTDVEQANDLLAALVEQRGQLNSARASLTVIDRLTGDVSRSSTSADQAHAALEQLVALNNDLIATHEQRNEVATAIDSVRDLQTRVTAVGRGSEQALVGLKEARMALAELEHFQQRVVETTTELDHARDALDAVTALQCDLAATDASTTQARSAVERLFDLTENVNAGVDQIKSAETNAERLIVLKDSIARQDDQLPAAEQIVERLIAMQNQLVTDERLQFLEAATNVERLIRIQAEIAGQTDNLVDSIRTLELLGDFQGEFNEQAGIVEEMRRQLTELILLQTTIEQALQVVEPISELGNLRRLGPQEIQEAARLILDQRRARLARDADVADVANLDSADAVDAVVEEETSGEDSEAGIHSPEIHRPVPVPPEEIPSVND